MTSREDRRRTLIERAELRVDWIAVERRRREAVVRARADRIDTLRRILFQDACRGQRDIESLTTEAAATRLLVQAHNQLHSRLVRAVLQVAIDNRWHAAVETGIRRSLYGHTATLMKELWTLTADRDAD